MGTMLIAREVPPYGGDTLFANMYLAYEALSVGMREPLGGLVAVNSSAKADVTKTREDRMRDAARGDARTQYEAEHPVGAPIPRPAGRRFTSIAGTPYASGDMTEEESVPVPAFCSPTKPGPNSPAAFAGRSGSLAFWDNRRAQHNPINDYHHGFRCAMHRVTLAGERPR